MDHGGSPDQNGPTGTDLRDRLMRIEEHAGFTEHTVEQLSAEMAELGKRMLEITRRVEAIERRLGELARGAEGAAEGGAGGGGAADEGDAAG
jgi:uncharacterized coiled-coil protein SlyX